MKSLFLIRLSCTIIAMIIMSVVPSFGESVSIDKSFARVLLGKHISYIEDKNSTLTLEDIKSAQFEKKWVQSKSDTLGFGFTKSAYWVRFTVENKTDEKSSFYLEQLYPLIDNIRFYFPGIKGYTLIEVGDRRPFHERPYYYRTFVFPLQLKAHSSSTCFMRYSSNSSMNIDLTAWSPDIFVSKILTDTMFQWMFYGIMLIMFVYNLFIYFSVRNISYIFLIMYIGFFCLLMMSLNGMSFMYLWPDSIWWANNCIPFFMALINFSIIQFARFFVRTQDRSREITKYADLPLLVLMIISLIFAVGTLFINNYRISIIATTILTGVDVTVGTLIAIIFVLIPGFWVRPLKFFLPAFILFLFGIMLYVLKTFALLPEVFLTTYGIQIGAVANVALLSFALADKINMMNIELKDLNENLEQKVFDRTEELQSASEEVEAMNDSLVALNEELIEAQRIAGLDMRMAVSVQAVLLPRNAPQSREWDTACYYQPMSGISGDFYDFYQYDDKFQGLILMDVSGHGISSSLVTMILRSVFSRHFIKGEEKSLSSIIEASNKDLIDEMGETGKYITGIILRFRDNIVEYVNAAHTDILLYRKENNGLVKTINHSDKDFKGMFLGMSEMAGSYEQLNFEVHRDDVLLLYTDALSESRNSNDEEYGIERLTDSMKKAPKSSAQEILDHLLKDLNDFVDYTPFADDLTIIVLKRLTEA